MNFLWGDCFLFFFGVESFKIMFNVKFTLYIFSSFFLLSDKSRSLKKMAISL